MQIVAPRFEEPLILNVGALIPQSSAVGWPPIDVSRNGSIVNTAGASA